MPGCVNRPAMYTAAIRPPLSQIDRVRLRPLFLDKPPPSTQLQHKFLFYVRTSTGVQHPPTWQTPLPVWSPHPVPPFRRPGLSPPSASVQMLLQCYRSRRCERARRREPLCHPPPSIRQFNADWTLTANRTNPIHHPICAQPAVPLPTAADGHDATRRRRIADPHSPPC